MNEPYRIRIAVAPQPMSRDEVLEYLQPVLAHVQSKAQAQQVLDAHMDDIRAAAAVAAGDRQVAVTLTEEFYPTREYEGFALPAGTYTSLRVILAEGEGRNWWCVVFPSLCLSAASDAVADAAAGAGFSDSLSGAITEQPQYEIRFYFLDLLGRLENFFHKP